MTELLVERNGRRIDLSFMSELGPSCAWRGDDLVLMGRAIGGVHRHAKAARPWLMALGELERAFAREDPGFALGDRSVILQMAVDAKAIGADEAAEGFADCVRFPALTPAEAARIRPALTFLAGRQARVQYEIKSDWDESKHPREPAGSSGGIGGQFTSKVMADDPASEDLRMSRFARALAQDGDVSRRQREMFYDVFNAEGFGRRDPADGAVAGIRRSTLDAAKAAGVVSRSVALERLTYQQVVAIYRWSAGNEIRRIGGARRYEEFDDPKDATAIFDTLFAHGHGAGAGMIQEGIKETLERLSDADLKRLGLSTEFEPDGVVGSRTFRILTILANNGQGALLRHWIAEKRRTWVAAKIDAHLRAGWLARIGRFE